MSGRFEGSYLGDARRISPSARMECKICWSVYDPSLGDEVRQIPPGTAFAALPEDWRCPTCDGERDQFMRLDAPEPRQPPVAPERAPETVGAQARAAFAEIFNAKMRDTPLVNRSLSVEAIGFRRWRDGALGVLVSPWFMNLLYAPDMAEAPRPRIGAKRVFEFPSGAYEFVFNERAELGPYWACSLFSPMTEFQSQLQASDTARAVMPALFDPANRSEDGDRRGEIRASREAALAPAEPTPQTVSRRALLTGGATEAPDQ